MKQPAIICLSGGQDSTTTLYQGLANGRDFEAAIYFDYGSKHRDQEIYWASMHASNNSIPFYIQPISFPEGSSALLKGSEQSVSDKSKLNPELPASFVPGRNLVFLTHAAILAASLGVNEIWTGVCQTDYSGYPDCRRDTMDALENVWKLGLGTSANASPRIMTPLMYLSKAGTFKMALDLGCEVFDKIIRQTHTGYNGDASELHPWGWGPAEGKPLDPASLIRKEGFEQFKFRYDEDYRDYLEWLEGQDEL